MKKKILNFTFYGDKLFDTDESNVDKQVIIDSILALEEVETNFQLNKVYSFVQEMYNQGKFDLDEYRTLKNHVESLQLSDIKLKWLWSEITYVVLGCLWLGMFLYSYFVKDVYTPSWFIAFLIFFIVHQMRFNRRKIHDYQQKIKEYQYLYKTK